MFDNNEKAVVVSGVLHSLDQVAQVCQNRGYRHFRLQGDVPVAGREEIVQAFKSCRGPAFFLLAKKAGGIGLNLSCAAHLVILEPEWNPTYDVQASGRISRPGQTKETFVYRLIAADTIEEEIVAVQRSKGQLAGEWLDPPPEYHEVRPQSRHVAKLWVVSTDGKARVLAKRFYSLERQI